ncbi:MAG: hypothetical protein RQ899_06145 [Pseudomonadales bacterium]|nr:hypothetical protein [Pseudomonadales bacterium]
MAIKMARVGLQKTSKPMQALPTLISKAQGVDTLLAVPEHGVMERIGLPSAAHPLPSGMASAGVANNPAQLYEALRLLHALQVHPAPTLSAEVEARLAAIPVTERTQEVRQRIGQDVFRVALMELWQGRCALSRAEFPPSLLRASHAKPWKELLSTVDWLLTKEKVSPDPESILDGVRHWPAGENWAQRKLTLFDQPKLELALNRLKQTPLQTAD